MTENVLKHLRSSGGNCLLGTLACTLLLAACSGKKPPASAARNATAGASSKAPRPVEKPPERAQTAERGVDDYTVVFARHVVFHEASGIDLKAEWLQGRMYPTRPGVIPSLDDPTSFKVEIEEGKTALSLDQLTQLLTAGPLKNADLKNIKLAAHGPREIEIRGTVHKLVVLPVQILGELGTTDDGRISIRIESVKVLKIPFKKMLHVLQLKPDDFLRADRSEGIQTLGDSVFLRTDKLLPAPRKLGRVTEVHFNREGDLEEQYGTHSNDAEGMPLLPENLDTKRWPNFIRLSGGTVVFGRLTMQNTDLLLIDSSPGNWFGFDIKRYKEQLVAGNMHMLASGGLQVWIPDINKVKKSS